MTGRRPIAARHESRAAIERALACPDLTMRDLRVLLAVLRTVADFDKITDTVSRKQLVELTRMDERHVRRSLRHLDDHRIIAVTPGKGSRPARVSLVPRGADVAPPGGADGESLGGPIRTPGGADSDTWGGRGRPPSEVFSEVFSEERVCEGPEVENVGSERSARASSTSERSSGRSNALPAVVDPGTHVPLDSRETMPAKAELAEALAEPAAVVNRWMAKNANPDHLDEFVAVIEDAVAKMGGGVVGRAIVAEALADVGPRRFASGIQTQLRARLPTEGEVARERGRILAKHAPPASTARQWTTPECALCGGRGWQYDEAADVTRTCVCRSAAS